MSTGIMINTILSILTILTILVFPSEVQSHGHGFTNHIGNVNCNDLIIPNDKYLYNAFMGSNSFWVVQFDRNQDGYQDYEIDYQTFQGFVEEYPLFYILDNNFNTSPDVIYIDIVVNADCKDVEIYADLSGNGFQLPDYDRKKRGRL